MLTRRAYEADAAAWAARGLDRSYASPRLRWFASSLVRNALILDLGCGPGFDAGELGRMGFRVAGLDITRAMLDVARSGSGGVQRLVQGDSRHLPFRGDAFAGVWASASLLHLPKAEVGSALTEIGRVLRPGGVFYSAMKEGNADGVDEPAAGATVRSPRYFAHYLREEWTALLRAAGFEVTAQDIDRDSRDGYPDWIVTLALRP